MTKQLKEIEIPFGAKDSELYSWEYTIPEGMEATIVDNKIVVKKKESEDERVRQFLIHEIEEASDSFMSYYNMSKKDVLAWLEKQGEQNNAWSEEDEKILKDIITDVKFEGYNNDMQADSYKKINWLKSLKDRIQPKQEWNEEDRKLIDETCDLINTLASGYGEKVTEPISFAGAQQINSIKTRLRALVDSRPQSQWKPSDEQIEALSHMIDAVEDEWVCEEPIGRELLEQLKKLKGEEV